MLLRFTKISALVSLWLLAACSGNVPEFELVEMEPKVVLSFELVANDKPVDIGDGFVDANGFAMNLQRFKFYVSDIALIGEGGQKTLSEVELVDFNDQQNGKDNTFQQHYSYIIPKGNYTQLRFSVGLPSELNDNDPTAEATDSPLSTLSGMYWDWASMYVFIMMEAGIDTTGDMLSDANIAFHTGLDTLFRPEQTYPMTFDIPAFAKDTIHVQVKWEQLFNATAETKIDLNEIPFFHGNAGPEALEMTRKFTENFIRAIEIKS